MKVVKEVLKGVKVIESPFFEDERGGFLKIFNRNVSFDICQINYVETKEKHTLRGLHYQQGEDAESKLFRCLKGSVQLGFLCIDPNNPEYGKSASYNLVTKKEALLIPRGFATGYLTLSTDAVVFYLSDNDYKSESERGVNWDDKVLDIDWETKSPITSQKDKLWDSWMK